MEQKRFNEELMRVFDSSLVKRRLASMMELTIRILELVSKYYQQQRHSE